MSCNEWKEYKLEELCEYRKDKVKIDDINLYNYISTENMMPNKGGIEIASSLPNSKTVARYLEGDILISNIRPYFKKIWYAKNDGGNSNDVLVFKNISKDKLNNTFLYYLLSSDNFFDYVMSTAKGTKMPRGDKDAIMRYNINLPSLEEQEKIANILSSLDDKIELNNEMNKTLEEMAQSIFKRWFVDFEFPNEDGEPYKSSGGEMVDSELGMIPKGWEVKSLDEIANFLNGLAMQKFRPLDTDEEFLQVVKIKELKQGSTSSDSDRCSINIDEKYIINDGDVIFAWSGSLDVRIWCGGKSGLNQHLFKVTSDDYPKWFYYLWVKNYLEQFIRIAADRATTMGHIKRSNLTEAKVLIPDDSTLKVMGYTLENLVCKFIENNIESKSLIDLRDSLLPKLMSGEISVN